MMLNKKTNEDFVSLFIFALQKRTTLLAKYSALHFEIITPQSIMVRQIGIGQIVLIGKSI